MTRDLELWACAGHVLAHHGDEAEEHARERMRDLARDGDDEGVKTWATILERVERLRRPNAPEALN